MTYAKRCPICEKIYKAKREDARYCSAACRQKAARRRQKASLDQEIEKIKTLNPAAARQILIIRKRGGRRAARAACLLFWFAAQPEDIAQRLDKSVMPERVADAPEARPVPDESPLKPLLVILPRPDCAQALRTLTPVDQLLLWKHRHGNWNTNPIRAQERELQSKGWIETEGERWRLTPAGQALGRYIAEGGEGVAPWTRSRIRELESTTPSTLANL